MRGHNIMAQKTLTGRNIRWYFNGKAFAMSRVTSLKPDVTQGLDKVLECGNPRIIEYAKKVPENAISLGFTIINKAQMAVAMGQSLSVTSTTGEVPPIPDNIDIVERRLQPGTEGTLSEVVQGYTLYEGVMIEKKAWDQEVDKLLAATVSAKSAEPRDFEGINAVVFENKTGNGSTTAFVIASSSAYNMLADGSLLIRAESPLGTVLRYGQFNDYTCASTSSTTTVTFAVPPASSSVPNILLVYAA
jgi:hypothetical protein